MTRRQPRSTRKESSAASDVYKRQNRDSEEVARFIGDADWSSPQAVKLIEKAIEIEMQN